MVALYSPNQTPQLIQAQGIEAGTTDQALNTPRSPDSAIAIYSISILTLSLLTGIDHCYYYSFSST